MPKNKRERYSIMVFTKMNVIQQNLSLVPRFVSIYMYYHVWGLSWASCFQSP
jgi:hypothetical protein